MTALEQTLARVTDLARRDASMTYPVENYDAFIDRLACLPDDPWRAKDEASLPDDDVREYGYEDEGGES